jgi:hypothetical protein
LFDAAAPSGTEQWSEDHVDVLVVQGELWLLLGESVPLTAAALQGDRYLEVSVCEGLGCDLASAVTLVGRQLLGSVPYAYGGAPGRDFHADGRLYDGHGEVMPAGAVLPFYLASCPSGWLPCDGTGGTPDLRGMFIRGAGTSARTKADGTTFSGSFGAYQADAFQNHSHTVGTWTSAFMASGSNYRPTYDDPNTTWPDTTSRRMIQSAIGINASENARTDHETHPANVSLTYCMKQ